MKTRSSARAKACEIPQKVKQIVFERDGGCCVICGSSYNVMPNSHYISRQNGGLGIEENVVTMCTELTDNQCHRKYDFGSREEREKIHDQVREYLMWKLKTYRNLSKFTPRD